MSSSRAPTNIGMRLCRRECCVVEMHPGCARRSARTRDVTSRARLLALLVGLDQVADLEVAVRTEGQTALVALADLDHVVLEPPQRADRQVLRDDGAVAQQPGPRVAPALTGHDQA